ncbi:Alpha-(1,3)-fucosyltransferase C [Mizuhopecten yessoensis]|uniref:Fucosyltransferase n=1 Tax=Mizuhopecten yessoensis TaxID=6573 RepID=A0A210QEL1_MIZYE|nr:Alpha-(1,3)-fucosyltransferase C [Mizuhopecten yessoensis]
MLTSVNTSLFVMATVLLMIFIASSVLTYIIIESEGMSVLPKMMSVHGMPQPRQVHMHFYNPPEWFSRYNVFRGCPSNCSMSVGRGQDYYDKDVVIFFGPRLGPKPVKKRRGQIWVLHGKEAPPQHNHIQKWKRLFNWTMTYRRDSDFPHMYGEFRTVPNPSARLPNTTFKFASVHNSTMPPKPKNKAHPTAWFVSHCQTQSKRKEYVTALRNTHAVDIFGVCGTSRCARGKEHGCLTPYKFYLSFENSLCRDYITEKTFKIFQNEFDTVPITRGIGGHYSLYLPPESFIDTSNYKNIDQLGHFLNHLNKNETLYLKYFKWRRHYQPRSDAYYSFCELCNRMHRPDVYTRYRRLYDDIHQWFFGSPNVTICKTPTDLRR